MSMRTEMPLNSEHAATEPSPGFSHEALLYAGPDDFVKGTTEFIRSALDAEAPIMVAVGAPKIGQLRAALGEASSRVHFVDMVEVGSNPARIIPAWHDFAGQQWSEERGVWGIGEPIWSGRSAAELIECQRHESLLNLAFADTPRFRLLCPYDTSALPSDVIHEAACSHPVLVESGAERPSDAYRGLNAIRAPFDVPLPDPPDRHQELSFSIDTLGILRRFVGQQAHRVGLDDTKASDLMLAVNEVAANSIRHGGGDGTLRVWRQDAVLVCEIADTGQIDKPLAGRERPALDQTGGWGLWLANQLCELVQVRTFATGSVVRLHMPLR
jgi:anti-sigma regulatory factor (Ser/Thr protein kinase)